MLMTKSQITAQKLNIQAQLKMLEEQEANFEKKAEGFKKLEELQEKYEENRIAMAKKYFITDEELEQLDAPKPVFSIPYRDSLGANKVYDWFKGKIGKAPKEIDTIKALGLEEVMKYITAEGKEFLESDDGTEAVKKWLTVKVKAA